MLAHKNNTKTFEELTYEEQARSLTIQLQNLKNQLLAHRNKGIEMNKKDLLVKYVKQLENIISDFMN